nr:Rne/Rng family ribonuclease [uncultured Cohaesibacter sp.]
MANQMLVDATHPEETRVVVVRGNRVEEFDFESANRKQLRGNIYLAKVTRVEPSLQAAFVDYGGNRHGFLAFSEIHPDYYQIPVADRQALLEEEKGHGNDDDDLEASADKEKPSKEKKSRKSRRRSSRSNRKNADDKTDAQATEAQASAEDQGEATDVEVVASTDGSVETTQAPATAEQDAASGEAASTASQAPEETAETASLDDEAVVVAYEGDEASINLSADKNADDSDDSDPSGTPPAQAHAIAEGKSVTADPDEIEDAEELDDEDHVSFEAIDDDDEDEDDSDEDSDVEHVGAEDALEEVPERRSRRRARQYKIQEVIKRRQILLVQVVKEERGNKGAALTTYLSLAGRYSVLMPNTARGGGISRKITNVTDRKRLKQIASDLEVADGMGVILRTAGASRTKTEIKRDFEYLLRLWENVRDLTLKSAAPLLVYEEGSLIKRSIRDLYNKDIDQVLVAGDEGYKEAKGFMKMLMPSHARNVQPYREPQPIFTRMGIESQLDAMFSPQVTLKSGGYIVIDQTEALVSIDVNSGRSTREHNIEDTALSTNLEAAEEISRQLRLRDLAGLVVIDFIDMEEKRNNRAVEKRLKDCLKSDRARIQVGRISHFGLLEMSRQRIRTGVLESTMDPCPHCHGTGYVRASASVALLILRTIEDHLLKGVSNHVIVKTRTNVALYILNQKRHNLFELESRFGVSITVEVDDSLEGGKHLEIERGEPLEQPIAPTQTVSMMMTDDLDDDLTEAEVEEDRERDEESSSKKRRRRRRRRKSNSDMQADAQNASDDQSDDESEANADGEEQSANGDEDGDDKPKKSRRRGRRGGRRNRRNRNGQDDMSADDADGENESNADASAQDGDADTSKTGKKDAEPVSDAASAPKDEGAASEQPDSTASAEADNEASANASPVEEASPEIAPPEAVTSQAAESDESDSVKADTTSESQSEEAVEAAENEAPEPQASEPEASEAEASQEAPKAESSEAETAAAEEKPAEQEEDKPEDNRPKRTGWWNRSGFL